jgi:16S rRNA (cytosine1402-N4)-methyltransferase
MKINHYSIMKEEILQYFEPVIEKGVFIDGTCGEGGHSLAVLERFPNARVVAIDRDPEILKKAAVRLGGWQPRFELVNSWNDEFFGERAADYKPAAILLDLGVSVFHYAESGRGFSFSREEPLDMRLDPGQGLSAASVVNEYGEARLTQLFGEYGEERFSGRIARAIVAQRKERPIESSLDLARLIEKAVPPSYRYGRIHAATRCFQALRIEVNGELKRLNALLRAAFDSLVPGGRLAVITFHSLEDREVKRSFRDWAKECSCPPQAMRCTCDKIPEARLVNKKPVIPSDEEIKINSPSRSAKLRVVEKV